MADRPTATTSKKAKKKRGRKRRVAGWGLLVIGALIAGVWGASRWWEFGYGTYRWYVRAFKGIVNVEMFEGNNTGREWILKVPSQSYWFGHVTDSPDQGWAWLHQNLPPVDGVTQHVYLRIARLDRVELSSGTVAHELLIMLWPFALVSLLGGGWLVWSGRRARRRAMTGVCLKCGYDRRGLATGSLCPECGGGNAAT